MSRLFGEPRQWGYVVNDIEQRMNTLIDMGAGPFIIFEEFHQRAVYRGEPHDVVLNAVFGQLGEAQVEFISQVNDAPSAFKDFMKRQPGGGLHHVAFECVNAREKLAEINAEVPRYELVQEFIYNDDLAHEIYLDPIEKHDNQISVQLVEQEVMFFIDIVKSMAKDWDGSRPVRTFQELEDVYLQANSQS